MTERSNFTVTGSIKQAKKQVRTGQVANQNAASTVSTGNPAATKFKGFGGQDSAQLIPQRKQVNLTKPRDPLFLPK
jgi:hypothetical protein